MNTGTIQQGYLPGDPLTVIGCTSVVRRPDVALRFAAYCRVFEKQLRDPESGTMLSRRALRLTSEFSHVST